MPRRIIIVEESTLVEWVFFCREDAELLRGLERVMRCPVCEKPMWNVGSSEVKLATDKDEFKFPVTLSRKNHPEGASVAAA